MWKIMCEPPWLVENREAKGEVGEADDATSQRNSSQETEEVTRPQGLGAYSDGRDVADRRLHDSNAPMSVSTHVWLEGRRIHNWITKHFLTLYWTGWNKRRYYREVCASGRGKRLKEMSEIYCDHIPYRMKWPLLHHLPLVNTLSAKLAASTVYHVKKGRVKESDTTPNNNIASSPAQRQNARHHVAYECPLSISDALHQYVKLHRVESGDILAAFDTEVLRADVNEDRKPADQWLSPAPLPHLTPTGIEPGLPKWEARAQGRMYSGTARVHVRRCIGSASTQGHKCAEKLSQHKCKGGCSNINWPSALRVGWSCVFNVKKRGSDTGDANTHFYRLVAPTRRACSVSVVTLRKGFALRRNYILSYLRASAFILKRFSQQSVAMRHVEQQPIRALTPASRTLPERRTLALTLVASMAARSVSPAAGVSSSLYCVDHRASNARRWRRASDATRRIATLYCENRFGMKRSDRRPAMFKSRAGSKKSAPRSRLLRERANMSFFIVVIFFAVFGIIVLTEIFLIDERGRGAGVLVRHGGGYRHRGPGERPDYEDAQGFLQPIRVIEMNTERRRNEWAGELGDPRENPLTNGIVRHYSHLRKSGDQDACDESLAARLRLVGMQNAFSFPRMHGGYWLLLRAPRMYSSEQAPAYLATNELHHINPDDKSFQIFMKQQGYGQLETVRSQSFVRVIPRHVFDFAFKVRWSDPSCLAATVTKWARLCIRFVSYDSIQQKPNRLKYAVYNANFDEPLRGVMRRIWTSGRNARTGRGHVRFPVTCRTTPSSRHVLHKRDYGSRPAPELERGSPCWETSTPAIRAAQHEIGIATVSVIVPQTCKVPWTGLSSVVFPEFTREYWYKTVDNFKNKAYFPHFLGAIDGKYTLGLLPYVFVADEAFGISLNVMRPYPGSHLTDSQRIFNYRLKIGLRQILAAVKVRLPGNTARFNGAVGLYGTKCFIAINSIITSRPHRIKNGLVALHYWCRTGRYSSGCINAPIYRHVLSKVVTRFLSVRILQQYHTNFTTVQQTLRTTVHKSSHLFLGTYDSSDLLPYAVRDPCLSTSLSDLLRRKYLRQSCASPSHNWQTTCEATTLVSVRHRRTLRSGERWGIYEVRLTEEEENGWSGGRADKCVVDVCVQAEDYLVYRGAGFDDNVGVFVREERPLGGAGAGPGEARPQDAAGKSVESHLPGVAPNLTAHDGVWQFVSGTRSAPPPPQHLYTAHYNYFLRTF
ncbi:hypothetical protein PR048_008614 [Dryococelus australis]|uniref:DDE Tnp4 domain-containing protein n=1 Tax=Dryococelus australis TaxID=614101 RepID=A0ABQ9HYK6_9NEOP|nr:hypothetical protein PR048_008614 [Dryococelus australis]